MADIAKHLLIAVKAAGGMAAEVDPASVTLSPALKQEVESAGSLFPQIALNLTAEPVVEFDTYDIAMVSTLAALSVASPVVIYFRALSDTFGFGAGYISLTMTAGLIEPVSISASRGERAKLRVRVHLASSDGDTSPVAVGTVSDTFLAPSDFYCLGTLTLGTAVGGVNDVTLTFGYSVTKNTGENGKPYPTLCYSATPQAAAFAANSEAMAFATQARLMQGTNESTVSMTWRKLNTAGVPTNSGGYSVTAAKANVTIGTLKGGRPGTIAISATCISTDFAGTGFLQFSAVA